MDSIKHELILLFFILIFPLNAFCQHCALKGKIIEENSSHPISYATVALYKQKDSTLISGGFTNNNGEFLLDKLPSGIYRLEAHFIGFQKVILQPLTIQPGTRDVGSISLRVLSQNIKAVTVKSTTPAISYQIDRKVINPESFPNADVAMDLLENIPSIQVDFNGNLTYRGDGTFKVYINGHPVPNGQEKLRQLSTKSIKQIEIITNPSAQYDSEGTAGIIQVILKKTRLEGYAINSSLTASTWKNWRYDLSVDHKNKTSGWYIKAFSEKAVLKNYKQEDYAEISSSATTSYTNESETSIKRWGNTTSIDVGYNKDLTEKDFLDFSGNINPVKEKLHTREQGSMSEITTNSNSVSSSSNYIFKSMDKYSDQSLGANLTYQHAFNKKKTHLFSIILSYSAKFNDLDEELKDSKTYTDSTTYEGFIYNEKNEKTFNGKIDYKQPLKNKFSFETGAQINLNKIPDISSVSGTFDENNTITEYDADIENQQVDFLQNIYAAYFEIGKEWAKFSAKLGLRSETTYRESDYSYSENSTIINEPDHIWFTNLFPSAHFSWSFSKQKQIYLNYSRRIQRPNYWGLIPLTQYASSYLYYTGNSSLKPSNSHSIEMGFEKSVDRNIFSIEGFGRYTENVIEIYNETLSNNEILYSPQNTGNSFSGGLEMTLVQNLYGWWNLNFSVNSFYYFLDIDYQDDQKKINRLKINSRLSSTFILPSKFILKWDFRYNTPFQSAQARRDGFWYADLSLKKTTKNKVWSATLVGHNIFSTYDYHIITKDEDGEFYMDTRKKQKPFISLKIAYNFDHQK